MCMGWGKKVIFMGNSFAWKSDFFFKSGGEGVGSTVTAGREGPDLGLFQGRIGRVSHDHFVLVEFIS